MKCKLCGDTRKPASKEYCNFCDKLYFKCEKITHFDREKPKKIVKKVNEKTCKKCEKIYVPITPRQSYCSKECRPKPMTEAEKWLNAKPRKNKLDSNQIAYGFFRKKYGVSKIYNAVRG